MIDFHENTVEWDGPCGMLMLALVYYRASQPEDFKFWTICEDDEQEIEEQDLRKNKA